jgi:hypothetical protein
LSEVIPIAGFPRNWTAQRITKTHSRKHNPWGSSTGPQLGRSFSPYLRLQLDMLNEGTLAKRMREQGQICCLCRLPLAPPHPMAERLCAKCSAPHRVYLHASNYSNFWFVQFLEEDLRTSFCGNLTYSTVDEIRELLRRLKVTVDQGEAFEEGIRRWSIGTCFVTLTTRQYVTLKTQFPRKGT